MTLQKVIRIIQAMIRKRLSPKHMTVLTRQIMQSIPFWTGAVITGFVSVGYAALYHYAEEMSVKVAAKNGLLFFFIAPVAFLVAWFVVKRIAPYARGSGIPQVMAAIDVASTAKRPYVKQLLGLKVLLVKVVSSVTMVFAGGIVGREGPTIQISGSIFTLINSLLPSWWPKVQLKTMIITGAASGLAAAFNTPLGGIVFALEELTKSHMNYFKTALVTGVMISGFAALMMLGPYLYIGFPQLEGFSRNIMLYVLVTAVISGICGSVTGKGILWVLDIQKKWKYRYAHVLFIIFTALLITAIGYFINRYAIGSGKDIILATLFEQQKHLPWYMPVLRMAGMLLSFSVGAAGGIFAPSLSAGACVGAACAGFWMLGEADANLIILCGMVGFLTGITRSPFTAAILVFEMTHSYIIISYLMITAVVANGSAFFIDKQSFYGRLKDGYLRQLQESTHTY